MQTDEYGLTLQEFIAGAKFCHYKGSKQLFVLFGPCAYAFPEQRNGKISVSIGAILTGIFARHGLGTRSTFMADLDANLRAMGMKQ